MSKSSKCLNCGKELPAGRKYCDTKCQKELEYKQYIQRWKNHEETGYRENKQLSLWVRRYMLEKANYACELCGWSEVNPETGKVPVQIHHIDGNAENSYEENLQVLCPNCHSLTPNFMSLNYGKGREGRGSAREKTKYYCVDCGKEISKYAIRCVDCENKNRITEKPVTREELKKLIRNFPFTTIATKFGVTDNAIRKWCDSYNLPRTKTVIKKYSDEEWELI